MGERSENNRDAADSRLFTSGGAIAKAELKIVNLKPGTGDDARIQFDVITLASYEPDIFAKRWQNVSVQGKIAVAKRIAFPLAKGGKKLALGRRARGDSTSRTSFGPEGATCLPREYRKSFMSK